MQCDLCLTRKPRCFAPPPPNWTGEGYQNNLQHSPLPLQILQESEIPSAALCTALRRYSTIPRAPVALVRRPSRLPRARTRRLPILHQPIVSAQLPLPVTRSMHLAEFQFPEPPTALSLNSTIPRAPVASVRRPPRCRWSTSRPSPQLHIHCLSPPLSHSAAQSMPIAKFQSPEPPTVLRLGSTLPRAPVAFTRRPPLRPRARSRRSPPPPAASVLHQLTQHPLPVWRERIRPSHTFFGRSYVS